MKKKISFAFSTSTVFLLAVFIVFKAAGQPVLKTKTLILPFHLGLTEVTYEVVDGWAIYEGDIVLGKDADLKDLKGMQLAVIPEDESLRWPNGVVPYKINAAIKATHDALIKDAIKHIEGKTSVKFVQRTNQANYVEFVYHNNSDHLCWSQIGKVGGRQLIQLHKDGCSLGTTIHEICHALGFWHEQSRLDRDEYITINYQNIIDKYISQFNKHGSAGLDFGKYDYGSIMHYGSHALSKNGQPTIVPKQPGVTIGQRNGLSDGDIDAINYMYPPIQPNVTGVFSASSKKPFLWVGANWSKFTDKWKSLSEDGYRLDDLEVHFENGKWLFSGKFEKGTGKYALYRFNNWDAFTDKWKELNSEGQRLVDVETFEDGGKRWYVGVWREGSGAFGLFLYNNWDDFTQKWSDLANDNLRLIDIESYFDNNKQHYIGVWTGGSDAYGLYNFSSWESFKNKNNELFDQNLRLVDFERTKTQNGFVYLGVWRAGTDKHSFWHNVSWSTFVKKRRELAEKGVYLLDFEIH